MKLPFFLLLIVLAGELLAGVLFFSGCRGLLPGMPGGNNVSRSTPGGTVAAPIDGYPTTAEQISHRPLAVMIENSPAARPQSGLTQADVVYEGITEGGITRFLAIYLRGAPAVIGPVRSARPHFIYLAQEFDPIFVHCGESYEALQILADKPPFYNLDQLKYGKPFWREHSREAPHNLYTSSERLRHFITEKGWDGSVPELPNFSHGGLLTNGTPAQDVQLNFSGAVHYRLRFVYDATAGGYLRYMDGKLHVDRETGQPIVVKNIVIQRVDASPFPQSVKDTYDVSVIGHGDGIFVSAGQQMPLIWSKLSAGNITRYSDTTLKPLPFQSGQTWIELVPLNGSVTISGTPPA